jgi:tRNA-2-methylthio-N6-dimethylallyladenosine synthase
MNVYDSELVESILTEAGYEFVPNEAEADVILLNTCSVRDNAQRKVFGKVHEIRHDRKKSVLIGILGCLASHLKEELFTNYDIGIDFAAGPDSYKILPEIINNVGRRTRASNVGRKSNFNLDDLEKYEDIYPTRASGINAWIAIMRGCDNFCTYCIVPYTRGRERSRSPHNIIEEAQRLAKDGFKQITLLGQNVNSYTAEGYDFADLLKAVSDIKGILRVRFTAPHPKDTSEKLIRLMAVHPKICKHLHFPLQAGNTRVLQMMNRTYTKEQYLDKVAMIRDICPQMAFTTDIIVGFPTETDAEFEDTLDVVTKVRYDSAFMFKYSERKGTLASQKYPDDVPEETKTDRIVRLNALQRGISLQKNQEMIGQTVEVLIEEESTQKSAQDKQGRTDGGRIVIINTADNTSLKRGDLVKVKITGATPNVLKSIL